MSETPNKPSSPASHQAQPRSQEQRLAQRLSHAVTDLHDCIETHPRLRGGIPCIRGTRVTAAQIVAQIAEGESIDEIAADMSIDRDLLSRFVAAISIFLDRVPE